jgi:hypothetical protein
MRRIAGRTSTRILIMIGPPARYRFHIVIFHPIATANDEGDEMPRKAWTEKRERQYRHIRDSEKQEGRSEEVAEEIAARTVNKERARSGESRSKSRTSTDDISSGRRGGLRSHKGAGGRTLKQLYSEARNKRIAGRSKMNKSELEKAVDKK